MTFPRLPAPFAEHAASRCALLLAAIGLAGCGGPKLTTPTDPSGEPTVPLPTATAGPSETPVATAASTASPATAGIDGAWTSPHCGSRTYERILTLGNGKYHARDEMAPCRPGTQCVWSGILERSGAYRIEGKELVLELEAEPSVPSIVPLPARLALDPGPVERPVGAADEPGCHYVRK